MRTMDLSHDFLLQASTSCEDQYSALDDFLASTPIDRGLWNFPGDALLLGGEDNAPDTNFDPTSIDNCVNESFAELAAFTDSEYKPTTSNEPQQSERNGTEQENDESNALTGSLAPSSFITQLLCSTDDDVAADAFPLGAQLSPPGGLEEQLQNEFSTVQTSAKEGRRAAGSAMSDNTQHKAEIQNVKNELSFTCSPSPSDSDNFSPGLGQGVESSQVTDQSDGFSEGCPDDNHSRGCSKPPTTAGITLDDLKAVFDLERPKAEKRLNLKRTTFSNLSRHFGISKWPYRTIRDVRNRQKANESILLEGNISKDKRRKLLDQQRNLDAVIQLIYTDPTESRDSNTLAVLLKIVESRRKGSRFG